MLEDFPLATVNPPLSAPRGPVKDFPRALVGARVLLGRMSNNPHVPCSNRRVGKIMVFVTVSRSSIVPHDAIFALSWRPPGGDVMKLAAENPEMAFERASRVSRPRQITISKKNRSPLSRTPGKILKTNRGSCHLLNGVFFKMYVVFKFALSLISCLGLVHSAGELLHTP